MVTTLLFFSKLTMMYVRCSGFLVEKSVGGVVRIKGNGFELERISERRGKREREGEREKERRTERRMR
jgi:hypothetical protein